MDIKKKAYELKARLEELKNQQYDIEGELYELQKQCEPQSRYGCMKVTIEQNEKNWNGEVLGEVVRISTYLLNEDEKDEHMKIFGSISGDWKRSRGSVGYYRNEYGVLNHTGGGWCLLKDGVPCSDDEWEDIKQGNIPDKFRTKNLD